MTDSILYAGTRADEEPSKAAAAAFKMIWWNVLKPLKTITREMKKMKMTMKMMTLDVSIYNEFAIY